MKFSLFIDKNQIFRIILELAYIYVHLYVHQYPYSTTTDIVNYATVVSDKSCIYGKLISEQ